MGVHGLWEILHPVARPIALETLGNKRLAIDSSIWLYQFQLAIRDKEGRALDNAHILGFLRRITKLLFYGIKPVFVFDGGAPLVKKVAISERKKRKRGGADNLAKTAEKLLAAQLRQQAIVEAQRRQLLHETGDIINDDTVFLEDLPTGVAARGAVDGTTMHRGGDEDTTAPKKKKYVHRDAYALPEMAGSIQERATLADPRMATEEELRDFIEDMRPEDFDVDSEWFNGLSTEVKYEIIGDLRIKSRQANHKRVEGMRQSATALDFSKAQIKHLMQRNDLTQKLFTVTDDISKSNTAPIRIASERNKHYVLIKNDASQVGGWALGVRDPKGTGTKDAPLQVDATTTDTDTAESHTSEAEFDPVPIPAEPRSSSPLQDTRKSKAINAVKRRYSPRKADKDKNMGPLPVQPSLFADGDLETIMPAAKDDPELWQDIVASYIPVKPTHSADSEDDEMFEEVLPPTNGLKANGHQIQPEQAHPDSDNDALEHVDLDPVPPMSISNDAQDTPATHIEEAVVCRDYAIPESEASKYRESPAAAYQAGEEEEEELDAGPSIVAAALATHESDSDSDLEQVTPVLAKASPAPLPPVKAAPAFQTREVSMSPPPLVRPRRKMQVDPPAPVASTSKVTLEVPLAAQDLIPAAKNVSAPHTIVPTQHLLPKRTVSGSKQWPSASNSAIPQQRQDTPSGFSDGSVEQAILQHVLEAQAKPTEEPLSRAASPDWADEPMEVTHKSASDWSRSPSPVSKGKAPAKVYGPDEVPDDFPLLAPGHELSEEEMDAGDRDDLEMAVNVQDEASRFSSFLNQLQTRNLDQVRGEVEAEISQLRGQRKKDRRDAEDITQQMSKDIQGMLRLFGLPFVIAPMEAEAQCAELYRLNLVDGIITDDSDVFLFEGGSKIYKNLFNQAKYVELYLASDVQRELGLERDDLIKLGYLLGSDYTSGIKGVGPVGALEIMKEFGSLENFRDWWRKVQRGQDDVNDTDTAFKRRFKKAQLKKELYLEETWPDPEVRKAYTHPSVDNSAERFLWGIPDLDGLRGYLAEHLGWSTLKVDDLLTPLIKRMQQRLSGVANMQGTLDSFFDTSGGTARFAKSKHAGSSQRMQNVIKSWKLSQKKEAGKKTVDDLLDPASEDEEQAPAPKPTRKRKAAPKRKASTEAVASKAKKPRKARKPKSKAVVETDGSEDADQVVLPPRPRAKSGRKTAKKASYTLPDGSSDED